MPHRLTPTHIHNYIHQLGLLHHHGGHAAAAQHHAQTIVGLGAEDPNFALHLHQQVLHRLRQGGQAAEADQLHAVTHAAVNAAGQQATQLLQQQGR